jgi:ADP-ribosylglycohydrolase
MQILWKYFNNEYQLYKMKPEKIKIKNMFTGLAIGDALSWTAMYHKSYLYPQWTRRLRREIDTEAEQYKIIRPNLPFSLNVPSDEFSLAPTDDTEWAAFTADIILKNNAVFNFERDVSAWRELAENGDEVMGGISTQAALRNLKKGIAPPSSGHNNPHYFDDGALPRAAVIGAFFGGNPVEAGSCAALDASITNSQDGVYCAQALAAAISIACAGNGIDEIIPEAVKHLPKESLSYRKAVEALAIVADHKTVFSALPVLTDNIADRIYNYGTAAAETFAFTLALTKLCGANFMQAVTAAASIAKTADSVPALTGALCGALSSENISDSVWSDKIKYLKGICLKNLAGVNYADIMEKFAEAVCS